MMQLLAPCILMRYLRLPSRTGLPVIFPVYSKNQNRFSSSKIIKTFADREVHQKALLDHILANYANENILIIGDSSATSIRNSDIIRSRLLQHDSIDEAKIIYPNQGYIRKDYVINALKPDVGNWVVLATDKRVISSDVINSLISLPVEEPEEEEDEEDEKKEKESDEPEMQILPEDTVIKVFGIFKSSQFDKIDNSKLAKLGFTFTSDSFTDENSPEIQLFNRQYLREKFRTIHPIMRQKAFDIVFDIGIRLASGKKLKETFKQGVSYRLESKFEYSKSLFNTSSNKGIYIIEYNPDLTLTRIK